MHSRFSGFFLIAATALAGFGTGVNFPTQRSCISPDFRWSIRCETEKQNGGYLHNLFLSRFPTSNEELIWTSERSCDVLWCDDSKFLAITDWSGSSAAEIYLVEVSHQTKALPLVVKAIEKIAQKEELEGHCYYEALRWEAPHRLVIRIFGHTDENPSHGFAYYLSVDTISDTAKLMKKENEEPNLMSEKKESATL